MYRIRIAVRYGREGFKAEVDQTRRLTRRNAFGEGRLEVDCVGNLLHEQLVTECPGHADEQVSGDAAHDPVHIHRAGKKGLLKSYDHEYGHAGYLQRRVPAPGAE